MSVLGLKLEYALSGRSACKVCKTKIEKGKLRIGQEIEFDDYSNWSWKHLECLSLGKKYKDVDPQEIDGYPDLQKKDRDLVVEFFESGGKKNKKSSISQQISTILDPPKKTDLDSDEDEDEIAKKTTKKQAKKKAKKEKSVSTSEDNNSDDEDDVKTKKKGKLTKVKKEKKNVEIGYTQTEKADFKRYSEMFEEKTIDYLKSILAVNNQPKTGTKKDLIIKCADGKTLGQIPMCPYCGGGKLRFDILSGTYKCPGYMDDDEFKNCGKKFSREEIKREPWIDNLIGI